MSHGNPMADRNSGIFRLNVKQIIKIFLERKTSLLNYYVISTFQYGSEYFSVL